MLKLTLACLIGVMTRLGAAAQIRPEPRWTGLAPLVLPDPVAPGPAACSEPRSPNRVREGEIVEAESNSGGYCRYAPDESTRVRANARFELRRLGD